MRGFIATGCLVLSGLLLGLPDLSAQDSSGYQVGVAQVDITPDYPVRLSGFGFRRTESEGVTQPIYAKSLAIRSGTGEPAVLITTDNLGIPATLVDEVAARLQRAVGLKRDRFTVTATHTHTAPMLKGVAPTLFSLPIPPDHQAHIDRYTRDITDKIEQAALAALKDLQPSSLSWGVGSVKFAINRRTKGGPVDHDLPVLVVKNPEGKIRAIYVNYACHCVTLSHNKISGDWAGYAQELIQREFPGAVALISVGCGADSNPESGVTGDKLAAAHNQGLEIATEIKRLTAGFLAPVRGDLITQLQTVTLEFATPPSREVFAERVKKGSYIGYHAQVQLARLDRGEALQSKLDYPVQTWSFGDSLAMVFLPGEVVVDYSLRLKRELDGQRLWITAYANDEPCYIPSERILKEGGYEGGEAMTYYDRPGPLKAGLEQQIVEAVQAQIGKTYAAKFDATKTQGTLPKSPQQSLATLHTNAKLQVDLVVAEPFVSDPVAIDFGADGDLWVAEMHDYPAGVNGDFQPGGRVRLVEDRDGDGRFDASSVFLENIPFPTGVTVWRDGVLICAAPDILFARDTNGDGKADEVKKLYSGFGTSNYQGRVNSLSYGLDGWVYGSCGLFGGQITNFKGQVFDLGDRDFRIKPDTGELEPATGRTQQGRVRDDWDNWFGCDNSNLCRHYPLPDHYLRRNPHRATQATAINVPGDPNFNHLFPATRQVQRFKLSGPDNNVTAACGLGIYRDTLLGADYQGNTFTCEPVNLLVHRLQITPLDTTFVGHRAPDEAESEFLAGTDEWFRPVQAKTGPDGGLWVVDMYRFVIEHPRWIPPTTLEQLDVRAGHSLGRIYRVRPRAGQLPVSPRLHQLDGPGLVAALETDNGWQRDLAGQMLIWKYAAVRAQVKPPAELTEVIEKLAALVLKSARPVARLQALCVLDVLNELKTNVVLQALADPEPGVRRHAVRVTERHLAKNKTLAKAVASLIDTDPQVSLQQAFTLTKLPDVESGVGLYMLAEMHGKDPQIAAAAISSLRKGNIGPLLQAAILEPQATPFHQHLLPQLVGQAVAFGATDELPEVLEFVTRRGSDGSYQPWQFAAVGETLTALTRQGKTLAQLTPPALQKPIREVLQKSLSRLQSDDAPAELRLAILDVLGQVPDQQAAELEVLGQLLGPQIDPDLQTKVVQTLGRMNSPQVPELLVTQWRSMSPSRQAQVLDLLLSRPAWTNDLLKFIEAEKILANQIDATRRQRLIAYAESTSMAAPKTLGGATSEDRVKVLAAYQDVPKLQGDPQRGEALFTKTCAACHRLGTVGQSVGPDLAALANKSPQFLLQEILDPNRNVDSRYISYTVVLKDGRVSVGLLAGESANSLTLRTPEGKELSVLRSEVDEFSSTGKSLMPEGLERDLSPAAIADIVAFLTRIPSPAKQLPGNLPALVVAANGRLSLLATDAEIRGDSILFEEPFQNIGYWHGLQDHVSWNARLDQSGEFDVHLDFACAAESAGNEFILTGTEPPITGKVPSTGGWDQYRQQKVGTVSLKAGANRISLMPAGNALQGALLDLKAIHLVPKGMALAQAEAPNPADKGLPPIFSKKVREIVTQLLDDKITGVKRQELINQNPKLAAEIIAGLTDELTPGTAEEYRRIPWIWRMAILTGKRNDTDEIRAVLTEALPQPNQPLHDWRAVVIGGGIINGISHEGIWPAPRLQEILKDQAALTIRWEMALVEAAKLADNERIPPGTRYDALRMIALDRWDRRGGQLEKYVAAGVHPELQMGAVSGLVDVNEPAATALLIAGMPHFVDHNRELAITGLLRGDVRQKALIESLEAGAIKVAWLNADQRTKLLKVTDEGLRLRAEKILK